MRATLPILVAFLGLNARAADEALRREGDLGRLQGRWTAMAGARREIRVVLEIKGRDVCVAITTPQGLDFQVQGELKLDEATTPRSLDWRKFSGPDQQPLPEIAAVYKIEGDTFTVCNGGFLGSRPREFKPGESVLADLVVFRRLVPKESQNSSTTAPASPGHPPSSSRSVVAESKKRGDSSARRARDVRQSPARPAGEAVSVRPQTTTAR